MRDPQEFHEQRARSAVQEGVDGPVTLDRVAAMMASHDASHTRDLEQLLEPDTAANNY